jgi:hypothetical protein
VLHSEEEESLLSYVNSSFLSFQCNACGAAFVTVCVFSKVVVALCVVLCCLVRCALCVVRVVCVSVCKCVRVCVCFFLNTWVCFLYTRVFYFN